MAESLPGLRLHCPTAGKPLIAGMIFDWLRDNDLLPACLADANPNRALPDRPVEGHMYPYMTNGTVRSDRPAGILSLNLSRLRICVGTGRPAQSPNGEIDTVARRAQAFHPNFRRPGTHAVTGSPTVAHLMVFFNLSYNQPC